MLHRIEEERHDYDHNIESCDRVIQLLEPIAKTLSGLSDAAKRQYELDPKLGGQSETIHKRLVYKLYGREEGAKVLLGLSEHPWMCVPVVLVRLRATRERWKAAQVRSLISRGYTVH